jgi:hypothetical protein
MANLFNGLKYYPRAKDKNWANTPVAKKSLLAGEIEPEKILKEKPDCLEKGIWKEACEQRRLQYGPRIGKMPLYPICPNVKAEIGKMPLPNILPTEQFSQPILNYIKRIMAVFDHLMSVKPTIDEIVLCAHRENILKDYLDLIKDDLKLLPTSLDLFYTGTEIFKKCKIFIQILNLKECEYEGNHISYYVYELPPDSAQHDFVTLLQWQRQPGMGPYALHYPAAAIEVMAKFYIELDRLVKIILDKEQHLPPGNGGRGETESKEQTEEIGGEVKMENTEKQRALQNLLTIIKIDIERDDKKPIVYKGKLIKGFKFSNNQIFTNLDSTGKVSENVLDLKPDNSSSNDFRMDTDREFDREVQLNRKYVEIVRLAISIWETYPDCSKPPMSNPNPKIGMLDVQAWAMKELKKAKVSETQPQENGGQGKTDSGEQVRKITKLTDFFRNCCEDTPSISSKTNRIHEFVKKYKIKFMPKTVNKPKRNETKLYYEDELRQVWPKLKEKIKSLPNLKD